MKVLIVYNKKSGLWNMFDYVSLAKKALEGQCESIETFEVKDWSGRIFEKYKDKEFDLIVAIGGDGTVNTCVTLILDYMPSAVLRIVPAGSGNILAASLGMSLLVQKNISKLRRLDDLKEIKIDVGRLNNKYYFTNGLSLGYLTHIIAGVEQNLKNKIGFGGYLLNFFKHRKSPQYSFSLIIDGQKFNIQASTLVVANAVSILGLSPRQRIDFSDGLFEVIYVEHNTWWGFLIGMLCFLFFKRPTKRFKRLPGKEIKIFQQDDKRLAEAQLDGDIIERDDGNKLVVRVLPKALRVLV